MYQENVYSAAQVPMSRMSPFFNQDFASLSGDDQTGTAYYVRTVYRRCRRNPDTGI